MVGAEKSETVPFGHGVMSGSQISAAVSSFVDYGTHLAEAAGLSRANVGAPCIYSKVLHVMSFQTICTNNF